MNTNGKDIESIAKRAVTVAVVLYNLFLAFQALAHQWGYYQVMVVFWFETLIIAAYNLIKIVVVVVRNGTNVSITRLFYGVLAAVFFIFKFGGFALGSAFVVFLILPSLPQHLGPGRQVIPLDKVVFAAQDAFGTISGSLPLVLLCLVICHGISFVANFVVRREYRQASVVLLLFLPYIRLAFVIAVMSVAAMIGTLAPQHARASAFATIVILFKLVADLAGQALESARMSSPRPRPLPSAQPPPLPRQPPPLPSTLRRQP
ncbi:MAG TPA: DUF6498-containing protein [Verrucomicrobiae bacterium]